MHARIHTSHADKMAQPEQVLTAKPDDLSQALEPHGGREPTSASCPLTSIVMPWHTHPVPPLHIMNKCLKISSSAFHTYHSL